MDPEVREAILMLLNTIKADSADDSPTYWNRRDMQRVALIEAWLDEQWKKEQETPLT